MRNIKELLELMLENQDCFCSGGLCGWASELCLARIITCEEYHFLGEYISHNRPHKWSSYDAFKHRHEVFYWTPYNIKPRIKWIKKHIKLNSK
ncbi:MAG: hypothetical protein RLY43_1240 [Bacteroidota bacterium]|jgi:hypothetical protein